MLNKGWDIKASEWHEAQGKAYFIGQADKGRLKVSFFGPFYGGYNIIELEKKDYAYSMVNRPRQILSLDIIPNQIIARGGFAEID